MMPCHVGCIQRTRVAARARSRREAGARPVVRPADTAGLCDTSAEAGETFQSGESRNVLSGERWKRPERREVKRLIQSPQVKLLSGAARGRRRRRRAGGCEADERLRPAGLLLVH